MLKKDGQFITPLAYTMFVCIFHSSYPILAMVDNQRTALAEIFHQSSSMYIFQALEFRGVTDGICWEE